MALMGLYLGFLSRNPVSLRFLNLTLSHKRNNQFSLSLFLLLDAVWSNKSDVPDDCVAEVSGGLVIKGSVK